MVDTEYAAAEPAKRLFIEMLTRDILLEDAVLDLVDNSIDSYVRSTDNSPSVSDIHPDLDEPDAGKEAQVIISYDADHFEISDNCGGIDIERARNDVFCFGKEQSSRHRGALSVYGIGLKRAVFKLGKEITVRSDDGKNAFEVTISVDKWLGDTDPRWRFPLAEIESSKNPKRAGTTIRVTDLHEDTRSRLTDGAFENLLTKHVGRTYALFLRRYTDVSVNGSHVSPRTIPMGSSEQITPGYLKKTVDGVSYEVFAGLAARSGESRWSQEVSGWYVACNGRVVVFADKSELTDWGVSLPSFQPQYRGFIGAVFFQADDPEDLPWTTTKRGVAKDSRVFRDALVDMKDCAVPVLRFLRSMYENIETESAAEVESNDAERQLTKDLAVAPLSDFQKDGDKEFLAQPNEKSLPKSVKVQYVAKRADVDRARECIGKRSAAASEIGRYALKYLLEQECDD